MRHKGVQKNPGRQYQGEPHGSSVADFLNGGWKAPERGVSRGTSAAERVVRLPADPASPEAIKKVEELVGLLQAKPSQKFPSMTGELSRAYAAQLIFDNYRWQLNLVNTKDPRYRILYSVVDDGRAHIGEAEMVQRLAELHGQKMVDHLRRCKQCSKWFFAHRKPQLYCTDACSKYHRHHSEEYRKYHRDQARKNYARVKYRKYLKAKKARVH